MGTIDQEGLRRLQSNWSKKRNRANSSSCASNLTTLPW